MKHSKQRQRGHRKPSQQMRKIRIPRTAKQFFAMSKEARGEWIDVTGVISKMRANRLSLTHDAIEVGIDPRVVMRLGKSALRKRKNGAYVAKRSDTLLRIFTIPTSDGKREIVTRDSREASWVGKYGNAVRKYLGTGDTSALVKLSRKRKTITDASGKKIRLLFDTTVLDRLGSEGELSFEGIYAETA